MAQSKVYLNGHYAGRSPGVLWRSCGEAEGGMGKEEVVVSDGDV
jgi:hypothetical protein